MKQLFLKILLTMALIAMSSETSAQWTLGLSGGLNSTTVSRYNGGRMDETYSALRGLNLALQGRFTVNSWLAVRVGMEFMQRSHRMDRNLNYLDPVFTEHLNNYAQLPVIADLSFGGERLRGHLLAGAYAGYWLNERRSGITYWMTDYYVYFEDFDETREFTTSDQRLNAGFSFGAGISCLISAKWEVGVDALFYYDIISHHKGYSNLADPRYLNTLTLNLTIGYKL